VFSKYGGTEVRFGADEYLILRESDVLAKVVTSKAKVKPRAAAVRRELTTRSTQTNGSQGAQVQRGSAPLPPAWRRQGRRRRQGDARPQGPLSRPRQDVV